MKASWYSALPAFLTMGGLTILSSCARDYSPPAPAVHAPAVPAVQPAPEPEPEPEETAAMDWSRYATEPAVRGVWITNVDSDILLSREKIAEGMERLAEANFNVVYPVVWNKSLTMYPSEVVRRYFGENPPGIETSDSVTLHILRGHQLGIDPVYEGRDPLQELIVEARRVGLEVVPWFEYGFMASHTSYENPIFHMYPDWVSLNRDGEPVIKNNFEWMDSLNPEVQQFMLELMMEVVENYDVDGVQGDDRLPALPTEGGYNPEIVEQYNYETGRHAPADTKEPHWVQWRADRLTDFLDRWHRELKEVDPELTLSVSPSPYPWGLEEYLQDNKTWADKALVDSLHPQLYRRALDAYQRTVDEAAQVHTEEQLRRLISPGILIKLGTYRIDPELLLQCIWYNRQKGIMGEVFFFYEGLVENNWGLLEALKAGPYAEPAPLPYRAGPGAAFRPDPIFVAASDARFEGVWSESAAGEDFREKSGGASGRAIYETSVTVDGIYDVYMKVPAGQSNYARQAVAVVPAMQVDFTREGEAHQEILNRLEQGAPALQLKYIDQRDAPSSYWLHLGSTNAKAGVTYTAATLLTNETNGEAATVTGPLMLLYNRKATREASEN